MKRSSQTKSDILKGYQIAIADTIDDFQKEWLAVEPNDIFLSYKFLKALEIAPPSGIKNVYAVVRQEGRIVGLLMYQYKKIQLHESLNLDNIEGGKLRKTASKMVKFHILVCGNMAVTGHHGDYFVDDILQEERDEIVSEVINEVKNHLKKQKIKIRSFICKDYYHQNNHLKQKGYLEIQVEPNMTMDIRPHWNKIDDYLADMKSKYRVRYKRTRKKIDGVEVRPMTTDELGKYQTKMNELYLSIARQASFNLFYLPENYFLNLAQHLGNDFECIGYFINGELEAFITLIHNGKNLDAHFIGYNQSFNHEYQLYANMLYDIIGYGIDHQCKNICFSRTASEIKSSAGAVAQDMNVYLRIVNPLVNKFLERGFRYFDPTQEWQPRSPFKD